MQKHAPLFWKNKGRDVGAFWEFIFGGLGSLYLGILSFGIFAGRGLFRSISLGFCTISARAAGGGGFYISDFFISYFCKNAFHISAKTRTAFLEKEVPNFAKNRTPVFSKTGALFLEKRDPCFWKNTTPVFGIFRGPLGPGKRFRVNPPIRGRPQEARTVPATNAPPMCGSRGWPRAPNRIRTNSRTQPPTPPRPRHWL